MSRGPENTFISSVHRHLPVNLYSMKNHNQFNGGIADCWYSGKSADLWVEYKFIDVPKRADTMIDLCNPKLLSALQQEWLESRYREGRNIAVIVGSKNGGVIFQNTDWMEPISSADFVSLLNARKSIADWITKQVNG